MTTVVTIAQTTLPATGTLASANIAAGLNQAVLTLTQVGWPLAGDKAFDYVIEWSPDAGVNWQFIAGDSVADVVQTSVRGSIDNKFKIVCTIPGVGSTTRRVRISWSNCKAGITVSGTIDAFTAA